MQPTRNFSRLILSCALIGAGLGSRLLDAQATAPEYVGYVFDIQPPGGWTSGEQRAIDLKLGQGLRDHEVVRIKTTPGDSKKSQAGASIRIGLIDGNVRIRDCGDDRKDTDGQPLCTKPINDISVSRGDTRISPLTRIWQVLQPPPGRLLFAYSRGVGAEELAQESVLPLNEAVPDLAAALRSVPKGDLNVSLALVNRPDPGVGAQTPSSQPSIQLKVRWNPPQALVSGPAVTPGLYVLRLSGPESAGVPVLIVNAKEAARLASIFEEARRTSSAWPPEMGDDARHYFLSSVLFQLNREP